MLEILQFIFSSFWIWLGFTILLTASASALSEPLLKLISSVGNIFHHKAECYRIARELVCKNDEWNIVQKIAILHQIKTKKGFEKFVAEYSQKMLDK